MAKILFEQIEPIKDQSVYFADAFTTGKSEKTIFIKALMP
jgi:hypothetical protein